MTSQWVSWICEECSRRLIELKKPFKYIGVRSACAQQCATLEFYTGDPTCGSVQGAAAIRRPHDTTTTHAPSDTACDVSLLETRRARGSRSYRVIALFRSDLSLEKVRENVGTYVLQLRKWRCARPRALYRGHRRLAYLIKGQESAHVVELTFDIFPSAVRYFRMKLDVDPAVLRFMILRNPPLPRSIVRRQYLIPPEEFSELVKYSGSFTT
eukprot:XP_028343223.1 uncharacterized protein LOC114485631 [Physeter catodon]